MRKNEIDCKFNLNGKFLVIQYKYMSMVREKKERKFFVKASGKKGLRLYADKCVRQQVVRTLVGSHRFQKHLR